MSRFLLTPERVQAIDWRQTYSAVARQEGVSIYCVYTARKRHGIPRPKLPMKVRRRITARIEAKRQEAA